MFPVHPTAINTVPERGGDKDAPVEPVDVQHIKQEQESLDEDLINLSADVSKSAFDDFDCGAEASDMSFTNLDPAKISPMKLDQPGQPSTEPGKDKLILISFFLTIYALICYMLYIYQKYL